MRLRNAGGGFCAVALSRWPTDRGGTEEAAAGAGGAGGGQDEAPDRTAREEIGRGLTRRQCGFRDRLAGKTSQGQEKS